MFQPHMTTQDYKDCYINVLHQKTIIKTYINALGIEAQSSLLFSLAEEGLIFLFWVVALVLMIVVFQEWQEDCSVVHPHLMMYKEREKQVPLEMVVGLGSYDDSDEDGDLGGITPLPLDELGVWLRFKRSLNTGRSCFLFLACSFVLHPP